MSDPVLVTGATGFVGSHLVDRLLRDGHRVRALARPTSPRLDRLTGTGVRVVGGDLLDPESVRAAVEGTACVFHLAAVMSGDPDTIHEVNVGGARALAAAALDAGVSRVVYLSDIEVYDIARADEGAVIEEDWPLQTDVAAMGPYVHSRIEAEAIFAEARERDGLPVVTLRSGMVIGPGGPWFFPQLGYQCAGRVFFVLRGGTNALPLVTIQSLVDVLVAASRNDEAIGRTYNVIEGERVTVREYIERIGRARGVPPRVVPLPFVLPLAASAAIEGLGRLGILGRVPTSRDRLRWKHAPVRFSSHRAREELSPGGSTSIGAAIDATVAGAGSEEGSSGAARPGGIPCASE